MAEPHEIEAKFWKALRSDMTLMLGLDGVADSHAQPMTAQFENDQDGGPIWFFTSKRDRPRTRTARKQQRSRRFRVEGPRPVRDHARQADHR